MTSVLAYVLAFLLVPGALVIALCVARVGAEPRRRRGSEKAAETEVLTADPPRHLGFPRGAEELTRLSHGEQPLLHGVGHRSPR